MLEQLLAEEADHGWRSEAACLAEDPELFFPEGESDRYRVQIAAALEVCATCDVAETCLRFAIETEQRTGVWGGTTATQRRGLEVVAGQVRPIARRRTVASDEFLRAAG
jgi:WhiB family transcriptional regulator, redox-sensing transcriptional regulator